jgi:addiction module HigA family antidote
VRGTASASAGQRRHRRRGSAEFAAWLRAKVKVGLPIAVGREGGVKHCLTYGGMDIESISHSFHVSRQALSNLFNGRAALSAEMAIRFEKAFGIKADTLMRMQTAYDMAQARAHADDIIVDEVGQLEKRSPLMR